ncbi:aminoglycoside phosphotransferase family protein, partial [Streptomyces sp. ISL-96]|nr:aminoglycoside phosphotransferase family protein [Streptomyces sp. ISL-96]
MTVLVAQALSAAAHDAAPRPPRSATPTPCPCAHPHILADRPDGTVVRHHDVVAKSHAPDTDLAALTARVAIAADPLLTGILLSPLPVP